MGRSVVGFVFVCVCAALAIIGVGRVVYCTIVVAMPSNHVLQTDWIARYMPIHMHIASRPTTTSYVCSIMRTRIRHRYFQNRNIAMYENIMFLSRWATSTVNDFARAILCRSITTHREFTVAIVPSFVVVCVFGSLVFATALAI